MENAFLVEGRKNVMELIHSEFIVKMIVATKHFLANHSSLLEPRAEEIVEVTAAELTSIGSFQTNEDCLAVAEMRHWSVTEISTDDHIFLLDRISDPGNLGTIIRTLDWFGFDQVICSPGSTDFYSPKVINATMGSFTRVKVFYEDLAATIEQLNLPVYGADMEGKPLQTVRFNQPAVFIMGNESQGISDELKKCLTERISIPGSDRSESLNVAIATAIIGYHLRAYSLNAL